MPRRERPPARTWWRELERHIRTEERQLFVLAENRMKPAEMAELGRQIKRSLGEGPQRGF